MKVVNLTFPSIMMVAILAVNILTLQAVKDLRKPMPPQKPKQITSVPVKLHPGLAIVEICREGCGFCKKMQTVLVDYKDFPLIKVDSTKHKELQGVPTPTYLLVRDGKILKQWVGFSDLKTFKERVK